MFQAPQAHHQEVYIVHAAYGILPLCRCLSCGAVGKELFFPNDRTTKTSAEGVNIIGCWYNLDLLMMGLWGLKHVEERRQRSLYVNKKAVYHVGNKE